MRSNQDHTDELGSSQVSRSPVMTGIERTIQRIAPSNLGVLLVGENGSGRSWVARRIHRQSKRTEVPIIEMHCRAIPFQKIEEYLCGCERITAEGIEVTPGILEQAHHGTLYIREIDRLASELQKLLIHVVEAQCVRRIGAKTQQSIDIRFIASMDRRPSAIVDGSLQQQNIFYRITPIIINIPPLRERREDIPVLIDEFYPSSLRLDGVRAISDEALESCSSYDWPGNVKQLRNAIVYAIYRCSQSTIRIEHLPRYVQNRSTDTRPDSHRRRLWRQLKHGSARASFPQKSDDETGIMNANANLLDTPHREKPETDGAEGGAIE